MATPTLKKETIQITLEKGSGTILVSRPDNTAKSIGLIRQFTYTGNATIPLMEALAAVRYELGAQMAAAAAKPTPPAAKPATTGAEPADEDDQTDANNEATEGDEAETDEAAAEQTDDDATSAEPDTEPDNEPTDPASAPHFDELSAPPELEPITTDDQAGDDLTDVTDVDDIQALLLF